MKKIVVFLLLCLGLMTACKKEDSSNSDAVKSKRVVLVYVFGDIDMWEPLLASLNEMERGVPSKEEGTLLVYLDNSPSVPQFREPVLLEISYDETANINSRVVKSYPKDQDAGDAEVFGSVLQQVTEAYPADSYGLVVAGHGTGWIVEPTTSKSIGNSVRVNGKFLDIDQLAAAIPASLHFDFIAFHACLMAEAAALYELRDKCDYVVASVELLSGYAFPYHLATKHLFTQPYADLYNFIKTTTNYYNNDVDKSRFGYHTLGLYDMTKMEQLAKAVKKGMESLPLSYDEMREALWSEISQSKNDSLMMYPWPKQSPRSERKQHFYDFSPFVNLVYVYNPEAAEELYKAIGNVVRKRDAVQGTATSTNAFDRYQIFATGISFYIPNKKVNAESDKAFYDRFGWSAAAGFTPQRELN